MCGITGLIHLDGEPVAPTVLQRMTDVIAHRGPDGEGHWIEGNVALGHRRLAIIDLTPAGHQPMMSTGSRHVLIYNGEVYNFRELRAELQALGYQFNSRTDSEVVLNALAACVTTSIVAHAAVRGIHIEELESELEGDIDLRGFLGLATDVPKGFTNIRVKFKVKTDAENLKRLKSLSEFSPVYNTITRGAKVDITVEPK